MHYHTTMKTAFRRLVSSLLEFQTRRLLKRRHFKKIIAVSGAVGKTTTKLAIATILHKKFEVLTQDGSFNDEIGLPLACRIATVGNRRIDRVAELKPVQAAPRLDCRENIRGRERQSWQAEGISGIGLLRRNHTASRPLIATVIARERHHADHTVTVDDRRPHIQPEAAVLVRLCRLQRRRHRIVIRQASTGIILRRNKTDSHDECYQQTGQQCKTQHLFHDNLLR